MDLSVVSWGLVWVLGGPGLVRVVEWLARYALAQRLLLLSTWLMGQPVGAVTLDEVASVARMMQAIGSTVPQATTWRAALLEALIAGVFWPLRLVAALRSTYRRAAHILSTDVQIRLTVTMRGAHRLHGREPHPPAPARAS